MTERHAWTDAEILKAYNAEGLFEQTFSLLKNPHHLAVRPQYHWTDQKLRVHISICLIALLLSRLLHKIAREQHEYSGGVDSLLDDLGTVRLALLMQASNRKGARPQCTWMLEERDYSILDFFKALVPNKEPFVYTA